MKRVLVVAGAMLLAASLVRGSAWAQGPINESDPGRPPQLTAPPPPPMPIEPIAVGSGPGDEVGVGEQAPGFAVGSSLGRTVRLSDLRNHWVAFVFTDSLGDLATFRSLDADLGKAGVNLYGVCPQAAAALQSYADGTQLPFTLLADTDRRLSQVYGMYDADTGQITNGVVMIDPNGIVRMMLSGPGLHTNELRALLLHAATGS
jgi:peroxiredoxin Q/BCP